MGLEPTTAWTTTPTTRPSATRPKSYEGGYLIRARVQVPEIFVPRLFPVVILAIYR
jgi:hypothetical protein